LSYELLPWDSEFFGFPIGRVTQPKASDSLADALARADAEGVRCLYYLVSADDPAALHEALRHGFQPYDIRVELERQLIGPGEPSAPAPSASSSAPASPPSDPVAVREAELADEPVLAELAMQTITATRFTLDHHFPRERIPHLYAAWVRRGLRSAAARRVLIADPAAGFLVCGLAHEDSIGSIELVGVASQFARRGIGPVLMHKAHAIMREAGCHDARVVTQGRNIAAQRLYQGLGYRTRAVAWWLHRWPTPH
jgi:dTDP-4-amino-4,6-dideoxy-D-galactose acyltransferase